MHQLAKNDLLGFYYVQISVKVKVTQSYPTLCNLWTIKSMEFSRPEYWSWSSNVSPADLPNPGMEPGSPALQEDSLPTELFRKGPGCEDAIANPRLKRAYVLNLFYLISSKYHICQNS